MDQDEKMVEIKNLGKEKKKIKTSTGLIAIFAAVVLFFGGAWTYWTYNDPNSYDNSSDSTLVSRSNTNSNANENTNALTNANANTNSVQNLPGFLRFDITNLGLYFQYPEEWETASIDNGKTKVDEGYSYNITFSGNSKITMGYASTDMTAGRGGTFIERMNLNANISNITNCATFKSDQNDTSITACEDVLVAGKTTGIVVSYSFTGEEMFSGDYTVGYYFTGNTQYPVVGIQIQDGENTNVTNFKTIIQSFGKI